MSYSVEPLHKGSPAPRKFWQVVDHLDEYGFSQLLGKVPVHHCVDETGEDAIAVLLIEHGHRSRVAQRLLQEILIGLALHQPHPRYD